MFSRFLHYKDDNFHSVDPRVRPWLFLITCSDSEGHVYLTFLTPLNASSEVNVLKNRARYESSTTEVNVIKNRSRYESSTTEVIVLKNWARYESSTTEINVPRKRARYDSGIHVHVTTALLMKSACTCMSTHLDVLACPCRCNDNTLCVGLKPVTVIYILPCLLLGLEGRTSWIQMA